LCALFDRTWSELGAAREDLLEYLHRWTGTVGLTVAKNKHGVAGANSSNVLCIAFCSGWLDGVPAGPRQQEQLTCGQHVAFRRGEADNLWHIVVDMEKRAPRMQLGHGPLCSRPAGGQRYVVSALMREPVVRHAADTSVPLKVVAGGTSATPASVSTSARRPAKTA